MTWNEGCLNFFLCCEGCHGFHSAESIKSSGSPATPYTYNNQWIQVYDSLYAPARPFLLRRAFPEQDTPPSHSRSGPNGISNSTTEPPIAAPGQAGRWREGKDDTVSMPS
ncbi:hypothetical protein DUNSADRAFT_4577 [Dunaliella salina]|uniref:Encoded protein n=1 Tax=Dunaliella salina TaxID=3046 RepID=A0ABQ7FUR4_DUNSA|nr:hypothetical protein DUNSADRAFT_4577 [Dunaliella salina]|eukprot:KAF5826145.1 hypothetical protein DUNSADRAFT_4577 [Dunaliella salina]